MSVQKPSPIGAKWSIDHEATAAQRQLAELVMAWAKDAKTGEPKYVFELGESRRGAHCGCICYSCGLPLTAVNAAKAEWRVRPHFRHPDGAERDACLVLTARAAALEQLRKYDTLVLPARRLGITVSGVSGKSYEAWVTHPTERVRIRSFKPQDLVSAVLTLDDGREVLVKLVGSLEEDVGGETRPIIQLLVNEPELAGLDPDSLKTRLHLLVENGAWCNGHWSDDELRAQAQEAARLQALNALDWMSEGAREELGDGPTHETLLHWLAKEILLQAKQIHVPEVVLEESCGIGVSMRNITVACRNASVLQLSDVRLEQKVGRVRPDVVARYVDPLDGATGQLLVEVTVTNEIHPERLDRIRQEGYAALEINIGRLGGTVTRQDFVQLVTEELSAKSWLFHPWLLEQESARRAQQEEQARHDEKELDELRGNFLSAAKQFAALRARETPGPEGRDERERAKSGLVELGEKLEAWGIEHASDEALYGWQGCLLDRLLSIRDNEAVGYRVETAWQVVNAVLCEKGADRLVWHTLYLIALKAYPIALTTEQQAKVSDWRQNVLMSLKLGERTFRRPRRYDALLGLLFPEMRMDLQKPLPGEHLSPVPSESNSEETKVRTSSNRWQRTYREPDDDGSGLWLRGPAFEEWKRQNPQAALAWEKRNQK